MTPARVGDALGGQASVRPVDSVNAALEFLQNTKRGQVLVFDSRDIAAIREEVDLAHAERRTPSCWYSRLRTRRNKSVPPSKDPTLAVLPIPIDKRKTAAILEGVITEAMAKKGSRTAAPAVTVEPYQARSESAPSGPSAGSASKTRRPDRLSQSPSIVRGLYMLFNKGKPAQAPVAAQPKHASVEDRASDRRG